MPSVLTAIATAFDEAPLKATTLADIGQLEKRLGVFSRGGPSTAAAEPAPEAATAGILQLQPGTVYVHAKRAEESIPQLAPLSRTGVEMVDAAFARRAEQLLQVRTEQPAVTSFGQMDSLCCPQRSDDMRVPSRVARLSDRT